MPFKVLNDVGRKQTGCLFLPPPADQGPCTVSELPASMPTAALLASGKAVLSTVPPLLLPALLSRKDECKRALMKSWAGWILRAV
mmetsp:Transcript_25253/g.44671  ORF Transcript_25253/g.44671 Transcript_25253/m.44671 type:complete len:85 (+) Transcript_25253:22-276(+)